MEVLAIVIAVLALGVSFWSVIYTRRATHAGEVQADIAKRVDRRDRKPVLDVMLPDTVNDGVTSALYWIRNDGPQDLDSLVVVRPATEDRIRYPVALMGGEFGDEAELGPLAMGQRAGLMLRIGPADELPEFRVRIKTRAGEDTWEETRLLDDPRFHLGAY